MKVSELLKQLQEFPDKDAYVTLYADNDRISSKELPYFYISGITLLPKSPISNVECSILLGESYDY